VRINYKVRYTTLYFLTTLRKSKSPNTIGMELDLQSIFGLQVHRCTHWLRPRNPNPPPLPLLPHFGSYKRALLVSQDRRHLFVTPCLILTGGSAHLWKQRSVKQKLTIGISLYLFRILVGLSL
jgi:hypothetical protein